MTDEKLTKQDLRSRLSNAYDEISALRAELAALRSELDTNRCDCSYTGCPHDRYRWLQRAERAERALAAARAMNDTQKATVRDMRARAEAARRALAATDEALDVERDQHGETHARAEAAEQDAARLARLVKEVRGRPGIWMGEQWHLDSHAALAAHEERVRGGGA